MESKGKALSYVMIGLGAMVAFYFAGPIGLGVLALFLLLRKA